MKRRTVVTIILFFVAIAIFSFILLQGVAHNWLFDLSLSKLQSETKIQPAFVTYTTLHYDDLSIDMQELLESINAHYAFQEVLLIDGDEAYVTYSVYRNGNTSSWCLAKINLKNRGHKELCTLNSPSEPYELSYLQTFENASGFYDGLNFVLSDGKNVVEYCFATGESREYRYNDYPFTQKSPSGIVLDFNNMEVDIDGSISQFSIADMQSNSSALATIPLLSLFKNSLQITETEIFAVLQTQNNWGESYAVLTVFDQNQWRYINSYYTNDVATRRCYVVPVK